MGVVVSEGDVNTGTADAAATGKMFKFIALGYEMSGKLCVSNYDAKWSQEMN